MGTLLFALLVAPDVRRLGADEFETREAAQDRLRLWVWPYFADLSRLRDHETDPEIRYRLGRVVRGASGLYEAGRALRLLFSGPLPAEFWTEDNRRAVWRLVLALELPTQWPVGSPGEWDLSALWRLNPEHDYYQSRTTGGVPFPGVAACCNLALDNLRAQLRERSKGP